MHRGVDAGASARAAHASAAGERGSGFGAAGVCCELVPWVTVFHTTHGAHITQCFVSHALGSGAGKGSGAAVIFIVFNRSMQL